MPDCDWYMGATFFSGPSSAPWTAAIVSLDGLLDVLVEVLHAARNAWIEVTEVNIAPVTAVRLTNSRREIRCIRFPPMEVDEAFARFLIVSEDRFGRWASPAAMLR